MAIEVREWAIPIRFEGVELSPLAIVIDQLGKHENMPQISEEASLWLWQFTTCHGRHRSDSSENIQKVVNEVLQLMNQNRQQLLETVRKTLMDRLPRSIWIYGLKTSRRSKPSPKASANAHGSVIK